MATFFESQTKSYTQVAILESNEISTVDFLQATENMIKLFGTN